MRKTCETLGSYDVTELSKEWQSLLELSPEIKKKWSKLSFDDMWSFIAVFCTEAQNRMLPNLTSLLNRARTLPHSNAEAERAFSMLTDTKKIKRNRLETKMTTRAALKARDETARTMTVSAEHIALMNPENLYTDKEAEYKGQGLTLFASAEQ